MNWTGAARTFGSSLLLVACCLVGAQDLYVSSEGTNSVKRYDGTTGAYVSDFVSAGSGGLSRPQGITFGPDGNLYVSSRDTGNVIRYNGLTGAFIDVFTAGFSFQIAADLTFRGGFLYVAEFGTNFNGMIRFDASTGQFVDIFTQGVVPRADGHVWDANGDLYVSSWGSNSILKFDGTTGAPLGTFASGGGLSGALDLRIGAGGDYYVNSFNTGNIKRYD